MADNRKAMSPDDIIGKWAVKGMHGAYVTKDPKYGYWTHFSAEAMLYDTEAEANTNCCIGQYPEQVVGLRSLEAQGRDISENLHEVE